MLKTARLCLRTKHRNVTQGRTDGQNGSSYYSGLHCEQCGRAVKTSTVNTGREHG